MNTNTLIIVVVVIIAIVAFYLINKSNTAKLANATVAAVVANAPAPCTPFTQADQDAQKKVLQNKCIALAAVPFVGQGTSFSCFRKIESQLTPVNNC